MTLKMVSMFGYEYDVYIRAAAVAVTLPMHAIILCQNPAAALIERCPRPLRLRSDVQDGSPRSVAPSLPMRRIKKTDADV